MSSDTTFTVYTIYINSQYNISAISINITGTT